MPETNHVHKLPSPEYFKKMCFSPLYYCYYLCILCYRKFLSDIKLRIMNACLSLGTNIATQKVQMRTLGSYTSALNICLFFIPPFMLTWSTMSYYMKQRVRKSFKIKSVSSRPFVRVTRKFRRVAKPNVSATRGIILRSHFVWKSRFDCRARTKTDHDRFQIEDQLRTPTKYHVTV